MPDVNKKVQIELSAKDNTKQAFDSASKNAEKTKISFGELVGGVALGQLAFSAVASALSTAGNAMGSFAKQSIQTAMDMQRMDAVLPVIAENTGRTKDEINSLITAIREEGKSMLEAKNITTHSDRAGF